MENRKSLRMDGDPDVISFPISCLYVFLRTECGKKMFMTLTAFVLSRVSPIRAS
jgi:hypothetical protein